ncbi:MAG TPA: sigma-70 family RNA polymerase sigma factor [Acidimicrobiales bacterium]|nr:sigma-70 family RNA polymerase sigma factor [Acidimicrobiales bacterium]
MDDAELVTSAQAGDSEAFAAIYDRYADSIHAFCHSVLRDRHEAADVTQDTFLTAAERLGQLRDPTKLRAWLFAIARHRALRHGERRARTMLTGEDAEVVSTGPAPDEPVRQEELQRLVWDAADGLSERDRAILDLNVRQGFDGQELADALGVEPSHAYVLVNRLKDQVERSIGALLVARHGRSDCDGLAQVLEGWDGKLSPLLRKRIARHVDSCEVCSDDRKRLASPLALLAATPLLAVPADVRDNVLGDLKLVSSSRRATGWDKHGFPPGIEAPRSRRGGFIAVAISVAAIVVAALLLAPGYDDGLSTTRIEASGPTVVPTSQALTSTTLAPEVPASLGGPIGPGGSIGPGGASSTAPGPKGNAPGAPPQDSGSPNPPAPAPTPAPAPAPEPAPSPAPPADTQPPDISTTAIPGCTVTLVATVRDASAIGSVTASWQGPDQIDRSGQMVSRGNGRYELTTPAYLRVGTVTWTVSATDVHGNAAQVTGSPSNATGCTAGAP